MHQKENKVNNPKIWKVNYYPAIVFFSLIILWQLMDYFLNIKEVILPNPYEIFISLVHNHNTLIINTLVTLFESLSGFLIGIIIGITLAIFFVYIPLTRKSLYPYAIALKATPIIVLAPVLVIWFGSGIFSKIIMSALISFFPILVGAVKGFSAIDEGYIDLFNSMNAKKYEIFFKLRLPSSLPYLFPALKISGALSVVGAVVAEFTGSSVGIGNIIIQATYYLDTSLVFAGIVMISLAGILLFYIIDYIEKKIVFWQKVDVV